ncbi:uncharacterized protein [Branchiostoma lanceolatum]|uniref:uncharacterized protein n=1 Tax=Branchiostoma lanceolatum TaxID=7740 RepID=UPI00345472B9
MQTVKMWTVLGLLLLAVHVKDSRAQNITSQMTSAQTVTNGSSTTPAPVTMTMQTMNLTFSVSDVTNATTRGTTMSTSMKTSQQVMVSSGATPSNTASPGFADVTNITNDVTSSKANTTTALISVNVTTTRMGDRTTNSSTSEKPSSMVAMTAGSSTVAMMPGNSTVAMAPGSSTVAMTPGNSTVAMIPGSSTASMVSITIVTPGSSPATPTSQPLSTPTTPMGQQSSSTTMSSSQPTAASRTPEEQSSAAVSEASTPEVQTSTSREVSSSPNVSIAAPTPKPGGLSMGAMIGIGVGCACALLVLIAVPIVLWRRKRQQEEMSTHVASQSDLWMDDVTYGRPSTGLGPSVRLSRIEIDGNTYSFTPVGAETKEAGSAGADEKSTFRPSLAAFSATNETNRPSVIEEDATE